MSPSPTFAYMPTRELLDQKRAIERANRAAQALRGEDDTPPPSSPNDYGALPPPSSPSPEAALAAGAGDACSKPYFEQIGGSFEQTGPSSPMAAQAYDKSGEYHAPRAARRGFEQFEQFEQPGARPDTGNAWPEPDRHLIGDDRTPAPPLEDCALPAGWEGWITKEAEACGCPRDYVAAGLIATASCWIGNSRHVAATANWVEPPHTWMALVGPPSTGKTPALKPLVEACRAVERDAEPGWQTAVSEYARVAEAARAIDERWCADVRAAIKDGKVAPARPAGAEIPPEPPRPRVVAMDATTEELQHLLANQTRGLLYMRDELSGWLGNHDRYGGNGGDRAFFLEAWNGGAYVVDRRNHSGQPVRIARTSVAMLGGLQPDRLREALAGADDGLAARFCYVWPDPTPIGPLPVECDAEARDRREQLTLTARRLCGLRNGSRLLRRPGPPCLAARRNHARLVRRDAPGRHEARAELPRTGGRLAWQDPGPGAALGTRL